MTLASTPSEHPASPPNNQIHIIPVHGTWGRLRFSFWSRTPFWFEEGSQFITRLRARLRSLGLEADIVPLRWSGANSVAKRYTAASWLVNALREQRRRNAGVRQVVIGHSHGGSVALLAMRDFQDKEVKLLLITLATPFMEVESRFISGKFALAVNGLENSAALLFCLLALTFQATFEASPETQFLALFAVVLIILALKTFIGKIGQTDAADQERLDDLHTMTEGGLTLKQPGRILVIRGVDDEAALVLAAGAIGNRISSGVLLWSALIAYYGTIFTLVVLYSVYFYADIMQDGRLKALGQTVVSSNVAKTLVLILFGCCALLPIVSGAFKTVYGREFLFKAFTYQINSQSSPDCAGDARIVTLPPLPRGGGLRHGIYHNEKASDLAADFIHEAYGLENTS